MGERLQFAPGLAHRKRRLVASSLQSWHLLAAAAAAAWALVLLLASTQLSPDLEVWAGGSSARAAAAAAAAVLAAADANVASDAGSNAADADADARRFDNLAVAVKSGRDVAADRVPIQMLTFLRGVSNVVLIGEAAGVRVGALEMVDVYSGLYGRLNVSDPLAGQLADAARRARADQPAGQAQQRSDSGGGGDAAAQAVTEAATTVDESTLGWQADAHKNLPGFRELFSRFPDADWFVMIDDDTFMFMDNLQRSLAHLDPDGEHYIGSRTMFFGCDGVTRMGDGPGFAHGGSGIVLSRGAIKRLVDGVDACIVKYKDCWAGDVRVGLCLRDLGISLTDPRGFHHDPPSRGFWFPPDACFRPVSFHHLLPQQMQRLADLEARVRAGLSGTDRRHVTVADVYHDWHGADASGVVVANADRRGGDFAIAEAPSADVCVLVCRATERCRSWTFDGTRCWLKDAVPFEEYREGAFAGVVSEHYVCQQ